MHNCKKCFIPGNYPGISIDDSGLCNLCRTFEPLSPETTLKLRASLEKELSQAAGNLRKKKYKYHCAIALSGGKDSSYLTWLLAKKYKLNVLTVTVDIGFLGAQAYRNLPHLIEKLGVDHIFIKEPDLFRTTYKYAFTHNFFSRNEGLACFLCSKLILNMTVNFAREHKIPWVASGHFDLKNPKLFLDAERNILTERSFDPVLFKLFSNRKCLYIPTNPAQKNKKLPLFLHPLNTLVDYSETKMVEELAVHVGLKKEDFSSTKTFCVISMATGYLYQKARGYNPYCMDVCNQIRNGIIDRDNVTIKDALMNGANRPETKKLATKALRSIGVLGPKIHDETRNKISPVKPVMGNGVVIKDDAGKPLLKQLDTKFLIPAELYRQTILEHNRNPRNFRKIEKATHMAEGYNPLCGDHFGVYLKVNSSGVIEDAAFEGSGCAISKASASMMTVSLMGKSIADVEVLFQEFHKLVRGELKPDEHHNHLEELTVFSGVWQYPARVKCALLSWQTMQGALEKTKTVSTETVIMGAVQ